MGVKGLTAFLKEKELIYNISLKDLKTKYNIKAIGIDFSLYLHKVCYRLDSDDKDNHKNNIIDYFKNQVNKTFKDFEIHYIFDSKSNELKKELIEQRKKNSKISICSEYFTDTIEYFKNNNIKYHISPDGIEAEQYAAKLIKENTIQAVLTEDIDSIVFGAEILIKNNKGNKCNVIILKDVLEKLDLTQNDLINISIMSGTDFNVKGIYNYGINRAYKFLKNNSEEEINKMLYSIKNYQHIYNLFNYYN